MCYILTIIRLLQEIFNVKTSIKMFETINILKKVLNDMFCNFRVKCNMSLNLVFYNW